MKLKTSILAIGAASLCAVPAHAGPLTRKELAEALKQRDEVIAALQARVAKLEQEQVEHTGQTQARPAVAADQATPATAAAGVAGTVAPSTASSDDDVALQSLSRSLVERGGLILAPWQVEIIPSFAYSNRVVQGLALVQTPEGIPTVADQRLREDQLQGTMALRLGLPFASQIDVRVPYNWLRTSRALGDGTSAVNSGSGIGDVEVALSHQIFREKGWRPALVGGLSWRFSTGRDPFRIRVASVATGSGTDEFRGRLTALKSSDPIVFFATLTYAHDLRAHESFGTVQNGDALGLDLGGALALNPDTSMTFGLSQEFQKSSRVDGSSLPGTDKINSSLELGFAQVISPRLLLDLSLGVGLTHDAPDYVFQVALPFRFR